MEGRGRDHIQDLLGDTIRALQQQDAAKQAEIDRLRQENERLTAIVETAVSTDAPKGSSTKAVEK